MQAKTLHTRIMLQQYELQLLTARRLARHRHKQYASSGVDAPKRQDPKEARKVVVQRVARELYETLLSTGTENPMVDTIVKRLSYALGAKVLLHYPTPSPLQEEHLRLLLVPEDDSDAPVPLSAEENVKALHLLWAIVLKTVEESTI